jgi:hypothetical protein
MPRRVVPGRALIALLSVVCAFTFSARVAVAQHTRAVRGGWPVSATAAVKLHVSSGSVEVVGWSRDSVHLDGDMADGESLFALGAPNGLKLGAEGRTARGASRLRVMVPHEVSLTIRSGAARVDVRDVRGTLDIGAAAGAVDVRGTPSVCLIESLAGNVLVDGTVDALRVRTSAGRIDVRGRVREAQLASVSGAVVVQAATLPALRVHTVSGAVSIVTTTAPRAPVHIETFGGDVTVERPRSVTAMLLRSDSGVITVDGRRRATDGSPSDAAARTFTVQSFRGAITVRAPAP